MQASEFIAAKKEKGFNDVYWLHTDDLDELTSF